MNRQRNGKDARKSTVAEETANKKTMEDSPRITRTLRCDAQTRWMTVLFLRKEPSKGQQSARLLFSLSDVFAQLLRERKLLFTARLLTISLHVCVCDRERMKRSVDAVASSLHCCVGPLLDLSRPDANALRHFLKQQHRHFAH